MHRWRSRRPSPALIETSVTPHPLAQLTGFSRFFLLILILLTAAGALSISVLLTTRQAISLPYDSTNPIIYDNDDTVDVYTDDYLMAMASAGDISLVGMITTSSVVPYNKYVPSDYYEQMVADRAEGVAHAKDSGFRNIPDTVRGVKGHLRRPSSGKIDDSTAIGSKGSRLIVDEARKATSEKPLVIVAGGPLTTVADAYLLDGSIADKLIVAWLGGRANDMADYNGWADPWAAYIVLERLKLIQFPVASVQSAWKNYLIMILQKVSFIQISTDATPYIPKSRLATLPDTSLRKWMMDKEHPFNDLPGMIDADGPPAISVVRGDYVLKAKKVSFSHWSTFDDHKVSVLKQDPNGQAMVVGMARKDVATHEWWRALDNYSAAYHGYLKGKIPH